WVIPLGGSDLGFLGGVIDARGHAVELVELALDAVRARRARHPADLQLNAGIRDERWCFGIHCMSFPVCGGGRRGPIGSVPVRVGVGALASGAVLRLDDELRSV